MVIICHSLEVDAPRDMGEAITSYQCKSCNSIFLLAFEVKYYKSMTGHQEYVERKQTSNHG